MTDVTEVRVYLQSTRGNVEERLTSNLLDNLRHQEICSMF